MISVGTAICGGSAIAAVAPVIKAKHHEVTVSLGIVFLLNAAALFVFPWVGHALHLTEWMFGVWSALAIHDTSSVVGATIQYGPEALSVGTIIKLTRALWIIPLTMGIGLYRSLTIKESTSSKPKRPWFILGFILAATLMTLFPDYRPYGDMVVTISKKLMIVILFLIGSGLTRETVRNVGLRPFIHGVVLWLLVASIALLCILLGIIEPS